MKKKLIIVFAVIFSIISMQAFSPKIEKADAATTAIVNPYNNQPAVDAKADAIIQTAEDLIGKATYATTESLVSTVPPYRFRCASFINFIFKQNGLDLGTADESQMIKEGYAVPRDQLQKGDLVFFDSTPNDHDNIPNHVALYIGDNKVIHMANSQLNIVISDLNSTSYYRDCYIGARRVLPSLLPANPPTKGDQIVSTAFALRNKVTISSTTNNIASLTFTNAGLVNYIFMQNGINLGTNSLKSLITLGTEVPYGNLQKGDLVFFNYTTGSKTPMVVAIYDGDNRLILSSPTNGFYTRVITLDWFQQHYITARRVY